MNMTEADRKTLFKIFLAPLAYFLLRLYLSLIQVRTLHEDALLQFLQTGRKVVAAVWHQRFLGVLGYVTKFRFLSLSVMISKSRDGDWIAPVAKWLGLRPVRRSCNRGGKEALAVMVQDLAQHQAAVHIVDGPKGPKAVIKAGLIRLAQLSKAAIVPTYISVDHAWVTRSWDRFLIPKPFSRILIRFRGTYRCAGANGFRGIRSPPPGGGEKNDRRPCPGRLKLRMEKGSLK